MASNSKKIRRGEKRPRHQTNESNLPKRKIDSNSPILASFKEYQQELDWRYDKHERLVKKSRDATIASKRIIFALQRVAGTENWEQIFQETSEKFSEVKEILKVIAEELQGEDPFLFARACSSGLQEYIEALSFAHYLKHKNLISFKQVQENFMFSNEGGKDLSLNPVDYILGIADLTGELMRLCINCAAAGDRKTPFDVCNFLRAVHEAFMSFGSVSKDMASKLRVLRSSLNKVENACYTLKVRGSEIPQHALAEVLNWEIDLEKMAVVSQDTDF